MSLQTKCQCDVAASSRAGASIHPPTGDDAAMVEEIVCDLFIHNSVLARSFASNINSSPLGLTVDEEGAHALECMLLGVMTMIASEINHPERILPSLHALAGTHLGSPSGIRRLEYVADALLSAVVTALGSEFCPLREAAWNRVVAMLVARMARVELASS